MKLSVYVIGFLFIIVVAFRLFGCSSVNYVPNTEISSQVIDSTGHLISKGIKIAAKKNNIKQINEKVVTVMIAAIETVNIVKDNQISLAEIFEVTKNHSLIQSLKVDEKVINIIESGIELILINGNIVADIKIIKQEDAEKLVQLFSVIKGEFPAESVNNNMSFPQNR